MDRKGLFSIGEVSKLFHISVSSLRHYENVGLLHPEYTSPDTGYRYYGPEQFEVLNTIRYLRALDMPLAEIEDFLKNKDISNIEEKLMQQKKIVLEKQLELKRMEQKNKSSFKCFIRSTEYTIGYGDFGTASSKPGCVGGSTFENRRIAGYGSSYQKVGSVKGRGSCISR